MVLTPRTDDHGKKIAPTWCKVIGHRDGMLLVMPEGDTDPSTVSLIWLNELRKDVHAVFKRVREEEASPEPKIAKVEVKSDVKTEVKEEPKTVKEEAKVEAKEEEPKTEVKAAKVAKVEVKADGKVDAGRVKMETEERKAAQPREEWLERPKQECPDGTPRAVFRAGCHEHCLTTVLGGVGTDMERINNKGEVTVGEGDAKHVLIRDGDMYMWGRFDWNPWAPSYPGDVGFYLHDDFENYLGEGQTEFHLFRQCTRNRMQMPISAWHGKDAAGKTIYCGKYMIDDEAVTSTIDWREIAISFPLTAKARIDLEVRWSKGRETEDNVRDRLYRANRVFTMVPVKPAGEGFYDEVLYQELVRQGCHNGYVETDPAKL